MNNFYYLLFIFLFILPLFISSADYPDYSAQYPDYKVKYEDGDEETKYRPQEMPRSDNGQNFSNEEGEYDDNSRD